MADRDFQELLNLIIKTSEQIDRLQGRIGNLEKQISSGDLGTGKIRELNAQIVNLQRNLQTKQVSLSGLLNERDLRAADAGLDKLNRSVETVRRNLERLYLLRSQGGATSNIEDQIRRQERALSLFEAQ